MISKRKRILMYSLTLLFLMACRTYACSSVSVDVAELGLDATLMDCQMFYQTPDDEGITRGYTCQIICPDIEGYYALDMREHPNIYFAGMTYQQLQARDCPASNAEESALSVVPTDTATPVPTATKEKSGAAQPTAIVPFLSGKYTACDLNKGFINFRQTEPKLDVTGKKVVLTMNGAPANCSIPTGNPDLYSCALPFGVKFPAEIIVTMNGTEINKFTIDGAACTTTAPNQGQEEEEQQQPTEEPEPTIDPND